MTEKYVKSFGGLTSRLIFSGVIGVVVCFVLAYNFKFSCYTGKVEIAPLTEPTIIALKTTIFAFISRREEPEAGVFQINSAELAETLSFQSAYCSDKWVERGFTTHSCL